jgi:hypothetical protein
MGEDWDIEENPSTEKKQYALSAVGKGLIGGFILGVVLTYATMIWPTKYRYETKMRCVFNYSAPYANEDFGKVASAKRLQRSITTTVTNESYRIDRMTGEMFMPEQGSWKLIGLAYDKPGEFLEGGITGTANTGCKIPYVAYEQSDANDGPWEEVKPDLSVKPSSVATKEGNK